MNIYLKHRYAEAAQGTIDVACPLQLCIITPILSALEDAGAACSLSNCWLCFLLKNRAAYLQFFLVPWLH